MEYSHNDRVSNIWGYLRGEVGQIQRILSIHFIVSNALSQHYCVHRKGQIIKTISHQCKERIFILLDEDESD